IHKQYTIVLPQLDRIGHLKAVAVSGDLTVGQDRAEPAPRGRRHSLRLRNQHITMTPHDCSSVSDTLLLPGIRIAYACDRNRHKEGKRQKVKGKKSIAIIFTFYLLPLQLDAYRCSSSKVRPKLGTKVARK